MIYEDVFSNASPAYVDVTTFYLKFFTCVLLQRLFFNVRLSRVKFFQLISKYKEPH